MHDDDVAELRAFGPMHCHNNWQSFFDEPLAYRLHAQAVFPQPARRLAGIAPDKHRDLFWLQRRIVLALLEPLAELRGNELEFLIESVEAFDQWCYASTKRAIASRGFCSILQVGKRSPGQNIQTEREVLLRGAIVESQPTRTADDVDPESRQHHLVPIDSLMRVLTDE